MEKSDKHALILFALAPFCAVACALIVLFGSTTIFRLVGREIGHEDTIFIVFGALGCGFVGLIGGPMLIWRRWLRHRSM